MNDVYEAQLAQCQKMWVIRRKLTCYPHFTK